MGLTKRTTEKSQKPQRPDAEGGTGRMGDVTGRELLENIRHRNEEAADSWESHEGEPCRYYDSGWRYGHIEKVPLSDEKRYGEIRIKHSMTGLCWCDAQDVRRVE